MLYLRVVDASSQPGDLALPLSSPRQSAVAESRIALFAGAPDGLLDELWRLGEAERCGLTLEEFGAALIRVGTKLNFCQPQGVFPDAAQKAAFLLSLRLGELALAHACSLGIETAWERFFAAYRHPLTQAAIGITGSATLGHDLADAVYSELYGLREIEGARRSPLASYSGRGSLLGWLRTTLAQRFVDHHRRTHRETSLDPLIDTLNIAAPPTAPITANMERLRGAVERTLERLPPEDRFLLSAYFLDGQTLLQIGQLLAVHEATISRRLKRLTSDLRKQLVHHLQAGGLSQRAAEEALGADPRDLEINLRQLLQSSQTSTFSKKTASSDQAASATTK